LVAVVAALGLPVAACVVSSEPAPPAFRVETPTVIEARAGERVTLLGSGLDKVTRVEGRDPGGKPLYIPVDPDSATPIFLTLLLPPDIGESPIVLHASGETVSLRFRRKWATQIAHAERWKSVSGGNGVYCAIDVTGTSYCFTPYTEFPSQAVVAFAGQPEPLPLVKMGEVGGTSVMGSSSPGLALDRQGRAVELSADPQLKFYGRTDLSAQLGERVFTAIDGHSGRGCVQDASHLLTCWNMVTSEGWPFILLKGDYPKELQFTSEVTATGYTEFRISVTKACRLRPGAELRCGGMPGGEVSVHAGSWVDVDLEAIRGGVALASDGTVHNVDAIGFRVDKRPGFERVRGSFERYCGRVGRKLFCKGIFDPEATPAVLGDSPSPVSEVTDFSVDNGSVCAIAAADGTLTCWGGDFAFNQLERYQ
jgi:hypothetical protein